MLIQAFSDQQKITVLSFLQMSLYICALLLPTLCAKLCMQCIWEKVFKS